MNRKEIAALLIGTVFLLIIIFAIALTFLGLIPFLFSKKLIDYVGIFLIISVISFAYSAFSLADGREESIGGKAVIAIKVFSVFFTIVFILAGTAITFFLSENLVKRNVSPDKKYEIYVEADSVFGGWNVTVYKRHTPFFKTQMNSVYIDDMADENGEIGLEWDSDNCSISYDYYPDYTSEDTKTITQRIYFNSGK